MKRLLLLAALAPLFFAHSAAAHVLLADRQAGASAVLHIDPGDDPVAGKPAGLYFEIESKQTDLDNYQLYITNDAGLTQEVPATPGKATLAASYTFPTQGLYKLELRRAVGQGGFTLPYSLRVSRGVVGNGAVAPKNSGAQILLIFALVATAMLTILFVNNRQKILEKSSL